jgi:hypothetical protein
MGCGGNRKPFVGLDMAFFDSADSHLFFVIIAVVAVFFAFFSSSPFFLFFPLAGWVQAGHVCGRVAAPDSAHCAVQGEEPSFWAQAPRK